MSSIKLSQFDDRLPDKVFLSKDDVLTSTGLSDWDWKLLLQSGKLIQATIGNKTLKKYTRKSVIEAFQND